MLVKCSDCGKEFDEKEAVKLTIDGKEHYFHYNHVKNLTHKTLTKVVFNKTFAELIAIATGLGGIIFTLQDFGNRALFMDTFSGIAAIAAFIVGIEHLKYLKKHNLLERTIPLIGTLFLITLIILVWNFGFR